ncbi:MAG: tRNA (adenosine(37)-N6)-threonylcarbamoyltransferase complex ATPase subunit type 1 TsaE [Planctomycetota bacterium]
MERTRRKLTTTSAEETRALGCRLGRLLRPGDLLAIHGELGAGKTTLCAGVGAGLEIPQRLVSPTYLLCREYRGRHPLLHLDAYFEPRMQALLEEGLAERLAEGPVVLVEWAEKVASWLPAERLEIFLSGVGPRRDIVLQARGERFLGLLGQIGGGPEHG